MRAFVVMCLVAVACADKLGYNYHPSPHSSSGISYGPGAGGGNLGGIGGGGGPSSGIGGGHHGGGLGGDPLGGLGGGPLGGLGGSGLGGLGGGPGGSGLGGLGGGPGGNGLGGLGGGPSSGFLNASPSIGGLDSDIDSDGLDAPSYSAPAELEKEFYTYSAPEGEFDDPQAAQRALSTVKQGLRVIFIKGPENKGLEDAALNLAKNAANQKTAIYVLNKQTDIGDLANKLNNINKNNNNKPEVHFVKYRTPEDAANAQRAIQSQYDQLGGKSQNINGGIAPVINFASQSPQSSHGPSARAPQNQYLPSAIFRYRRRYRR